jgi:hypothetical protein
MGYRVRNRGSEDMSTDRSVGVLDVDADGDSPTQEQFSVRFFLAATRGQPRPVGGYEAPDGGLRLVVCTGESGDAYEVLVFDASSGKRLRRLYQAEPEAEEVIDNMRRGRM